MIGYWQKKKTENLTRIYRDDGNEEVITKSQFIDRLIEEQKEKVRNFQNPGHRKNPRDNRTTFFMGHGDL